MISWQAAERIKDAASIHLKDDETGNHATNNKAPVPWLVSCIQMYIVTEVARMISFASLCPQLLKEPKFEDLVTIQKYYASNGDECKQEVEEIKNAIINCLDANATFKAVIKRIFSEDRRDQMMLPATMLILLCSIVEICKDEQLSPFRSELFFLGNGKTPPLGLTARTMPVLGKVKNGKIPPVDERKPIETLDDVAFRNTIPKGHKKKIAYPMNLGIVAQANFAPLDPNVQANPDIKRNDAILQMWTEPFKLDVKRYKQPPPPKPKPEPKKRGGKKKSDAKKKATSETSKQPSKEHSKKEEVLNDDCDSLQGLVTSTGAPPIVAAAMSAATIDITSTPAHSVAVVSADRMNKSHNRQKDSSSAVSSSKRRKASISNKVLTKAFQKMGNDGPTTAVQEDAMALSPTKHAPQNDQDTKVMLWSYLKTVQKYTRECHPPTKLNAVQKLKRMNFVDKSLHRALELCESLARNGGYNESEGPASFNFAQEKNDKYVSPFVNKLKVPLLENRGIVLEGKNAQLKKTTTNIKIVAKAFGWNGTSIEDKLNPADVEKCAIVFEVPDNNVLTKAVAEELMADPKEYAKEMPKQTDVAAVYQQLLARSLVQITNKGWVLNTVPNHEIVVVMWESYHQYMHGIKSNQTPKG